MPGFRAQILCGGVVGLVVWWLLTPYTPVSFSVLLACSAALLGSLLPDCDTPSKGRQIIDVVTIPLIILFWAQQFYFLAGVLVSFYCIARLSPHRGALHTVWFPMVYCGAIAWYAYQRGLPFLIIWWSLVFVLLGYLSHLALDRAVRFIR